MYALPLKLIIFALVKPSALTGTHVIDRSKDRRCWQNATFLPPKNVNFQRRIFCL